MEFLIKEAIEINWYYSPNEVVQEVNKERTINKITLSYDDQVKSAIDCLKMGHTFLKIEGSVGSYYCPNEKKQVLRFSVNPQNSELIKEQIQGLFEFIISELGQGKTISQQDINNQAYLLSDYYYRSRFVEKLEEKLPEKEKASVKKPKI